MNKEELYRKIFEALLLVQDRQLRDAQDVLEDLLNRVQFIKEIK